MCLITKQKEPFVALEDMKVYKILSHQDENGFLYPKFSTFRYELGRLFKVEMVANNTPNTIFDDVAEAYYGLQDPFTWENEAKKLTNVHEGFHSFATMERFLAIKNRMSRYILADCTIPKGSLYFLDATGLCVSNQIIINQRITP